VEPFEPAVGTVVYFAGFGTSPASRVATQGLVVEPPPGDSFWAGRVAVESGGKLLSFDIHKVFATEAEAAKRAWEEELLILENLAHLARLHEETATKLGKLANDNLASASQIHESRRGALSWHHLHRPVGASAWPVPLATENKL